MARLCLANFAVVIVGMLPCSGVAQSIFKCVDAGGGVSFQATACPSGTTQRDVTIRNDQSTPDPAEAAGKLSATEPPAINPRGLYVDKAPYRAPQPGAVYTPPVAESYECKTGDGRVFYQHTPCPGTISTTTPTWTNCTGSRCQTLSPSLPQTAVTSRQVSREEACQKMNRAGAIGRDGHNLDQRASTYDKNLGRDPCR